MKKYLKFFVPIYGLVWVLDDLEMSSTWAVTIWLYNIGVLLAIIIPSVLSCVPKV